MDRKITKAEAGYVFAPKSDVTCEDCQFRRDTGHCAYFGPSVTISFPEGSCNRWKQGNSAGVPFLEPFFAKEQLGYVENKNGFGCRCCKHFSPSKDDCDEVNKNSPGFNPGTISPYGCCDFQKPDPERGEMSERQLVKIVEKSKARIIRSA